MLKVLKVLADKTQTLKKKQEKNRGLIQYKDVVLPP